MTESLKDRIRRLRTQAQWGQRELADRLGVTQRTICSWETGRHYPEGFHLKIMADLFGVTLTYLVDGPEQTAAEPGKIEAKLTGERLRALRLKAGLTVAEVAARLGVTHSVIGRAEAGGQLIRAWRLPALARLYGCSVDYLLEGREQPHLAALHRAIRVGAPQAQLLAMISHYD